MFHLPDWLIVRGTGVLYFWHIQEKCINTEIFGHAFHSTVPTIECNQMMLKKQCPHELSEDIITQALLLR